MIWFVPKKRAGSQPPLVSLIPDNVRGWFSPSYLKCLLKVLSPLFLFFSADCKRCQDAQGSQHGRFCCTEAPATQSMHLWIWWKWGFSCGHSLWALLWSWAAWLPFHCPAQLSSLAEPVVPAAGTVPMAQQPRVPADPLKEALSETEMKNSCNQKCMLSRICAVTPGDKWISHITPKSKQGHSQEQLWDWCYGQRPSLFFFLSFAKVFFVKSFCFVRQKMMLCIIC